MGITKNNQFNIGAVNLFNPTPHIYADLKMDEYGGDVINDSSGNGHHLTWDTLNRLGYDANTAGIWTIDGLTFVDAIAHEVFSAATTLEYPFHNENYSSIYVAKLATTGVVVAENASILCKRDGIDTTQDGGFQWFISAVNQMPYCVFHGGSDGTFCTSLPGTTEATIAEKTTSMICFDATTNEVLMFTCGDSINVQHRSTVIVSPTGTVDNANLITKATIGARGQLLSGSEKSNNISINGIKCYHDMAGAALPNNLGDICRWLHLHPDNHIPAHWWS